MYLHDQPTIECKQRTLIGTEQIEVYTIYCRPSIDGMTILGPDTSKSITINLTLRTLYVDDKIVAKCAVDALRSKFKLTKALQLKLKKFFESRSLLKAQ